MLGIKNQLYMHHAKDMIIYLYVLGKILKEGSSDTAYPPISH